MMAFRKKAGEKTHIVGIYLVVKSKWKQKTGSN